ncbi:MAG: arginine N-succinyltransferase [Gammaproteobacteria bacterium]|nr:arginine N-succinyltransferase [Gammaproteobacteria bacterium]NNF60550.1 arginine N-succinyltransferase [Gammaproteobacteria bacterium]NNM20268.1 arginine N-succinyltransferase [Gammaproteobacteria bacterium]
MNTATTMNSPAPKRRFSGLQVLGIVFLAILVTALITAFVLKRYLWPSEFRPVELNQKEEQVLEGKLQRLQSLDGNVAVSGGDPLVVEAYSEDDAKREIFFEERELNALIARNTNLANRLAVDLSSNLASAKLLVPLADDFPVMGGKTLRVTAGVEMAFENSRPIVILKGISMMGVPIPNAWLGNLKNVDLVREFGGNEGFWKTFSEGVELIEVSDGRLHIKLKE